MFEVKRLVHAVHEREERERRNTPSMIFIDSDHRRHCSASPYDINPNPSRVTKTSISV